MPEHAHSHSHAPSGTTIAVEQAHRDINLETMRTYVELGEGCYWTVSALAWSRSGRYCASAGADDTLRIWDMEVRHQIRRYVWRHELGAVCDLVWSPDDRYIGVLAEVPHGAQGSHGAQIVVLHALSGEEAFRRDATTDPELNVMELAWTAPAAIEQSTAPQGGPHTSPENIAAYPRDPARSWSADGRYVVTNSHENWRSVAGAPQALGSHLLGLPVDEVDEAVPRTPSADGARNGHRITLGTASVWARASGRVVLGFPDGTSWVAWAPQDTRIASVHGRAVTVWDAERGTAQCEYRGHAGLFTHVTCLSWAPSGEYIATGDSSGVIHIWQVRGQRGEA